MEAKAVVAGELSSMDGSLSLSVRPALVELTTTAWTLAHHSTGQTDGAAFAEVTKQGRLVYLGRLPAQASPVIWREIKSNGPYLVVGSEGVGHQVQIFDMRKLLRVDPRKPKIFSTVTDLTGLFTGEYRIQWRCFA